jgi:hypothetical protein
VSLNLPTLADLFKQLGLSAKQPHIDRFIERHQLNAHADLVSAIFWTEDQKAFLQEAIAEDSEWCEVVDELASLLIRKP